MSSSSPAAASAAAALATRTRSTAPAPPSSRTLSGPGWATGTSELAPHYDTAERMLGVAPTTRARPCRRAAAGVRRGDRGRRDIHQHPGRGVLGDRARPSPTPTSAARGRSAGLHALRQLHGRLSPRRQEHPGQELPLVRREARASRDPRAPGDRDPPTRRRRRLRGLRADEQARRGLAARQAGAQDDRRGVSSPPAPSAPTAPAAASTPGRCHGSPTASARWSGPIRSRSRRSPPATTRATSAARSRSPRSSTPTPTPTSRSSPTARATRCRPLLADDRRGEPADPAAEVDRGDAAPPAAHGAMLVPHRWSRRTVILLVMQTVDAAISLKPKRRLLGRAGGAPADRGAGPRAAQSDLHPSRRAGGVLVRRSGHRRRATERPHRVGAQHPHHRPHPRRRGGRRRRRRPASSTSATECSATRTCWSATAPPIPANVGVNPAPHDHRAGRARHDPHPTEGQPG